MSKIRLLWWIKHVDSPELTSIGCKSSSSPDVRKNWSFPFRRYRGTPRRLYTDLRAQSARRSRSSYGRRIGSASSGNASAGMRPKSLEIENRMTSPECDTVFTGTGLEDASRRYVVLRLSTLSFRHEKGWKTKKSLYKIFRYGRVYFTVRVIN